MEAAAVSNPQILSQALEASCTLSIASTESFDSSLDTNINAGESADDGPCELDKPEYKTDDFRLYAFKIAPCTNEAPHDWCLCPFAHPGEKAMRRDPRLYKYTGVSCPDYRKGTCKRGNACPYAHGVFEVWLHPSRYRTQLCKDEAHCTRQVCFFAHAPDELRQVAAEDLPALNEASDSSSGCSNLLRSDSDSTLSTDTMEPTNMPKCGPNTNAKAAAVAKAKAAAAALAAEKAATAPTDKTDKPASKPSLLSRSSNNSSPATVGGKLGVQSYGGLTNSYSSSMLSLLSQGSLGVGASSLGSLSSVLGHHGRMASLPLTPDLAVDAAVASRSGSGLGSLCDTFGSLDIAATAGGLGIGNCWSSSPAAVGDSSLTAAALAAASMGLPTQQLGLGGDYLGQQVAGQLGLFNSSDLALAAAAQQAATQQQQLQDIMTVMLMQQQQQQQQLQQEQQHRQAMWAAAFSAAANVGLDSATAAACADAAVQTTTAAASNFNGVNATSAMVAGGLASSQMLPASSQQLAGLQDLQQMNPVAALMQQQQHAGLQNVLAGGFLNGMEGFAGQYQLQHSIQ